MAKETCCSCGRKVVIHPRDRNYLHKSTEFLCSKECLLHKIKSYKSNEQVIPDLKYDMSYSLDSNQLTKGYSQILEMSFRSEYEAAVAEFLNSSSIDFLYEPFCFKFGVFTYTPDFYIKPPYDCFIEVKGVFGIGKKKKLTQFIEAYPNVNFIFVPWTLRSQFIPDESHSNT